MRKILSHLLGSPFVLVTSVAALIHSSWALATIFGGTEPALGGEWLGWLIPGVLTAISIDVGLLSTSMQIRDGKGNRARMATFVVLAASMFLLQFFYAVTHFPNVPLSAGVRPEWAAFLSFFRDAMIVVGPALLPVAITLHTFANEKPALESIADSEETEISTLIISSQDMAVQPSHTCPKCGRSFASAGGLVLHSRRCRAGVQMPLPQREEIRIEMPNEDR
jgi:hypothetical protein